MTRVKPPQAHQVDDLSPKLARGVKRCLESWVVIAVHANDWQRGFPSGHLATTEATGDESTLERSEYDPGKAAEEWVRRWVRTIEDVLNLAAQSHALNPKQPVLDDSRSREASVRPCEACNRTVACTTADPIRSGFCKPCYDAWWRKRGTLERADFIKQRRAMLGADLEATG